MFEGPLDGVDPLADDAGGVKGGPLANDWHGKWMWKKGRGVSQERELV